MLHDSFLIPFASDVRYKIIRFFFLLYYKSVKIKIDISQNDYIFITSII